MKFVKHAVIILAALFVTLGIPMLYYLDAGTLFPGRADAVTGASLTLPDKPSGQFVVLLNREKHGNTAALWTDFFSDRPVDVIMEDLSCMTVQGDADGIQLAERYQARLAENQLSLRTESPVLVASRAENGLFDVIVLSREMADAYQFSTVYGNSSIAVIPVKGAPQ